MSDARRSQDDEPLTQLDVAIDTKHLDSLVEGEAVTSPGAEPPVTELEGADAEPKTLEPPRVMGAPRLRAHTIMGVAPPSSGANAPSTLEPDTSSMPKVVADVDDEQTTMVGKLLAEAHAEVAKRLKQKESDLYADETATTVGDAEKLIATAKAAAALAAAGGLPKTDDVEEATESRQVRDALMEDTTSRRDAINIDAALARAAELRAEAEARRKKALKKQTIHGLGNGPLELPARPNAQDEVPTSENRLDPETVPREDAKAIIASAIPSFADPADAEMETLSAGMPQPAPMPRLQTEPETLQVQVPLTPRELRERQVSSPVGDGQVGLLGGPTPVEPHVPSRPSHENAPFGSPMTQPMPHAPTVRMDDHVAAAHGDKAFRQTLNSPLEMPAAPLTGPHPHYNSTPMPVAAPFNGLAHGGTHGVPHSGPAAFAQTAFATGSGPAVVDAPPPRPAEQEEKKKGGAGGWIVFLLLVGVLAGAGYWQRAYLQAMWSRYRNPPPAATATAPIPTTTASADPSSAPSNAPATPPPVATDHPAPHASSSASPRGSSSAAPHGSSSAAPRASASAAPSASASAKKKPTPPVWRPPPPKPKPAVPKPVDDSRGF